MACAAWATELRDLGYYGMMIGNPDHIPLVHEVFSPTDDELAFWQELDRLATEAEGRGAGRIEYGDPNQGEGYVVHIAHVGSARKNLAWARDLGLDRLARTSGGAIDDDDEEHDGR